MRPFTRIEAVAAPVHRPNIDTDVLIPISRLIEHRPDELGPFLFEPWRYLDDGRPDPHFSLNQERYEGAEVLVAGQNFGCGSSREHAVWALASFGIRCVIAPTFGDIFRQNCFQNGVLPLALPELDVAQLVDELAADTPVVTVDLVDQVVVFPSGRQVRFDFDAERRRALLDGLDDIGTTLTFSDEIRAFEADDLVTRPWSYRTSKEVAVKQLLLLAGDGVGAELMPQVQRVVQWFIDHRDLPVVIHEEPFGIRSWNERGTLMSDETWARIESADAILFGAIGSPQYDEIPREHRQTDWLLEMRRSLDLYQNLRPVRAYESLLDSSTLRRDVVAGVDMVIVRELAGGAYFGEPRGIEELPEGGRKAYNTIVYTTGEIERIARDAFRLARTRRGRVCSVDKANVLEFGALWREVVSAVHASEFPDVELSHMYVDNCAMQLVRNPRQFDVVVTENLFGDIISDCAAMVSGSLGMLPSAALGPRRADGNRAALYEPIHGSAPDIAGQNIANPMGSILSFAMCLRHSLDRPQDARSLEEAAEAALAGGARTRDIAGPDDAVLSTDAMADAVLAQLAAKAQPA
ncbi:MAG TPA: 3-isopropylmalate dehydrogenase [Ilumatobacteraceae bacterium]|nr:3-isopropylmalate dehydrogenase [Ilumatobacteraceae bacterium]